MLPLFQLISLSDFIDCIAVLFYSTTFAKC